MECNFPPWDWIIGSILLLASSVLSTVPREAAARMLWLPDEARSLGIHVMASRGSGKSRLLGRIIAWLDFLRGTPVILFDPIGSTADNVIDKLTRLPRHLQEQLWRRVLYVDMSGKGGHVVPFPLYYRFGTESLYEISQRYLDVVRKIDPNLQSASIYGWNQVYRVGTAVGMVLAALGLQITEAEDLIRNPGRWQARFQRALSLHPELQSTIEFFHEFAEWKEETRLQKTDAYLNKIAQFRYDPVLTAMFGASMPGVNLPEVMDRRLLVLLDFRHVHDIEMRRFIMVWTFHYVLSYIKFRGAGRHRPISLIIDELTALLSPGALAGELFAAELDELINVLSRNYMIWLTIAHQELFQVNERIQKSLRTLGTQIIGVTTDRDAALTLARDFDRYEPYWVKKREPIYSSYMGISNVIDWTSTEFTVDEQTVLNSYQYMDQPKFHFLAKVAQREGDMRGSLRPMSIASFDRGLYVNEALVAEARRLLMARRGCVVPEVLAEIEARRDDSEHMRRQLGASPLEISSPSFTPFARMNHDALGTDDDADNPTEFGEKKSKKGARSRR